MGVARHVPMSTHGDGSKRGTFTRIQRTSAVHAAMAELAKVCGKGRLLDELATIWQNLLLTNRSWSESICCGYIPRYSPSTNTTRMPRRGAGRGGGRGGGRGDGGTTEAAIQIENDVVAFVDITQAPPDVAKHYLEAYDGNMEAAVAGFLEGGLNDVQRGGGAGTGGRELGAVDLEDKDSDYKEEEDGEEEISDDSLDQLQTLASHRSRRNRSRRGGRRNRNVNDLDDDDGEEEEDEEDDDEDDDEDYMSEDLYGEEEERFKYGRRTRRGHRRSMRVSKQQMERQQSREDGDGNGDGDGDEKDAAQHIPAAVLRLPDVNIEEQKMLMAAMTGQAYTGEIPDFSNYQPYPSKPLSPGAIERQNLREEQDLAFQESLAMDRERQQREEQALIDQMEREESQRQKERIMLEELEEKKRRLPAEPASDDPMGIVLAIRMPDGTRLKRRFSKADTLRSVFDYVDVECGPGLAHTAYRLVTNFPRKVFESRAQQQQASLGELGFSLLEALFVETAMI